MAGCVFLVQRPLGMARQGGDQPVEFDARLQYVLAPERPDRALTHPLAFADALHEVEVAVAPAVVSRTNMTALYVGDIYKSIK